MRPIVGGMFQPFGGGGRRGRRTSLLRQSKYPGVQCLAPAVLLAMLIFAVAAPAANAAGLPPLTAKFVTSICRGPRGGIWVATEGRGVWHYNPRLGGGWRSDPIGTAANHNVADAVVCDTHGRIWVGSLNEGVFVYLPPRDPGQSGQWQRYGLLTDPAKGELAGPIGEHVYSMTVDPVDGSLWICTNSGISRYEPGRAKVQGRWRYYDVADGLPSDDIQCVAFGRHGRAYVATTCCGIAISAPTRKSFLANRKDNRRSALQYVHWRIIASRFTHGPPLTPTGRGLPSNLINAMITTRKGEVWVATDEGVAWSTDHGRRWSFLRGADWAAKDAGLLHPPGAAFIQNAGRRVPRSGVLSSDYCTALAEGTGGKILIGHRKTGLDIIGPATGTIWRSQLAAKGKPGYLSHHYIDAILARYRGVTVLGGYGGGLQTLPTGRAHHARSESGSRRRRAIGGPSRMPAAAQPPTMAELHRREQQVVALVKRMARKKHLVAVPLDTDWRTEGNWLGRYGDYSIVLAAAAYEASMHWGQGWDDPQWNAWMGPHPGRSDGLRRWVQWLFTSDRRVLEMPKPVFLAQWMRGLVPGNIKSLCRRESEWDDHGEAYPSTTQGPGLFVRFSIPPGLYVLAIYDVNYNGHSGLMRFRDYPVTLNLDPSTASGYTKEQCVERSARFVILRTAGPSRPVAVARFARFYGGEWVRFLIRGPNLFTIHLGRNYSLNTMLPCASVSLAESRPPPYFYPFPTHNQCSFGKYVGHHRWVPDVPPKPKIKTGHLIPIARYLYEHYRYPSPAELIAWSASTPLWASEIRRLASVGRGIYAKKVAAKAMHLLYRLHHFRRMERVQSDAGFLTARRIELQMPWMPNVVHGVNSLGPAIFQPYMEARGYYQRQRRAERALAAQVR